jgi:hypothetical protein
VPPPFDYRAGWNRGTVPAMNDAIFVALLAGFFVASRLCVRLCEKL